MPPELAALQSAARALGLTSTDAQLLQLVRYLDLLRHWNGTYNLTAVRDPMAMLSQHLVDCMAAVPAMQRWMGDRESARVLDVGSGGGLPGLVWAVLMPKLQVHCVDAVGKKAAFIRQAAGELGLPVKAHHARVESLSVPAFELITSRAFSSLADFTRLTRPQLSSDGVWLAMKGQRPDDEIEMVDPAIASVFHVEPLAVPGLDAERCLVWLRGPRSTRPPE